MPPKKRKTTAATKQKAPEETIIWLLTFSSEYYGERDQEIQAFSSTERAVAAMPKLMDEKCPAGSDWRNGLKGFGKRNEENYLGYKYNEGCSNGVLISNEYAEDSESVEVRLEAIVVDPPEAGNEMRNEAETSEDDEDGGAVFLRL